MRPIGNIPAPSDGSRAIALRRSQCIHGFNWKSIVNELRMPTYTFKLRDGAGDLEDEAGVHLPGRKYALNYARDVVHELMNGREKQTRAWCLDVYENGLKIFEVPFAALDPTLDHLMPAIRAEFEAHCGRRRALAEAIFAARRTVSEARAVMARSRGRLYLASRYGKSTIRDS